jgi:hypothetical protein
MQVERDAKFNPWSLRLADEHKGEGRPVVYIRIKKLRPTRSRIEELEIQMLG